MIPPRDLLLKWWQPIMSDNEGDLSSSVQPRRGQRLLPLRTIAWHALPLLLPIVLVVIWHCASTFGGLNRSVLPGPHKIVDVAASLIERGQLQHHILLSLRRVAIGFFLGASIGLALGIVVGLSAVARQFTNLTVQMVRAVPHLTPRA
jgi:sulfonate transport system permease protein